GHSASPPQIRACGFPALGSSRGWSASSSESLPRVTKVRTRERKACEILVEAVPVEPPLAAASQRAKPAPADFIVETVHCMPVARQTVVTIVPTKDAAYPPMLVGQRGMHAPTLFRSHGVQLPRESLAVGPPLHDSAG